MHKKLILLNNNCTFVKRIIHFLGINNCSLASNGGEWCFKNNIMNDFRVTVFHNFNEYSNIEASNTVYSKSSNIENSLYEIDGFVVHNIDFDSADSSSREILISDLIEGVGDNIIFVSASYKKLFDVKTSYDMPFSFSTIKDTTTICKGSNLYLTDSSETNNIVGYKLTDFDIPTSESDTYRLHLAIGYKN